MVDKSLVIRDDKGKFKDLGDVLAVARSQGKILFRTKKNVFVKRLSRDFEFGWIAIVSLQPLNFGCSNSAGCKPREKKMKNEYRERRIRRNRVTAQTRNLAAHRVSNV